MCATALHIVKLVFYVFEAETQSSEDSFYIYSFWTIVQHIIRFSRKSYEIWCDIVSRLFLN